MKYFILLIGLICVNTNAQTVITDSTEQRSLLGILKEQKVIRLALPPEQINANPALRKYGEERFYFSLLDTLETMFPGLVGKVKDLRAAFFDSTRRAWLDSARVSNPNKYNARWIKWVTADSMANLRKIKRKRILGIIVYASRDSLIAIVKRRKYKRIIKRDIAVGRLGALKSVSMKYLRFADVTEFNSVLNTERAKYDTTIILHY